MDLLQQNGFWEDLVDCGGSREYIMSMPASDLVVDNMGKSDIRSLQSELNEHNVSKKGKHKEVRSSLGNINAGKGLIRTLSAITETGLKTMFWFL